MICGNFVKVAKIDKHNKATKLQLQQQQNNFKWQEKHEDRFSLPSFVLYDYENIAD